MTDLATDEKYFTYEKNDIQKNLIECGLILLNNIRLIDELSDENLINTINMKREWLDYWKLQLEEYSNTNTGNDILTNQALIIFDNLNLFYNLNYTFNISYFNVLRGDSQEIYNYIRNIYVKDPQMVYQLIKVLSILEIQIPTQVELYINSNLDFWLYQDAPQFSISELYFEIKLAKIYNIYFSEHKIFAYLIKYLSLQDKLDIKELYYTLSICDELKGNYDLSFLQQHINTINKDFKGESLEDIIYILKINKNYEIVNISSYTHNLDIDNIISNLEYDKELFYAVNILQEFDTKIDVNVVRKKINEFDANNGSYLLKLNNDLTSIYSTFRMIEVKKVIGDVINEEQRISINKYVETLEGQYGGYFITEVSDGEDEIEAYNTKFNLESFYYAISIKKFLNK